MQGQYACVLRTYPHFHLVEGGGWMFGAASVSPFVFAEKMRLLHAYSYSTRPRILYSIHYPLAAVASDHFLEVLGRTTNKLFFFSFVLLPASLTVGLSCSTHLEMDSFLCFFLLFHCAVVLLSLLCSPLFPLVPCFFFFPSCVCFVYRFLELAFFFFADLKSRAFSFLSSLANTVFFYFTLVLI